MFQGLTLEPFDLPAEVELIREEVREFLARELDPDRLPNSDFNAGESAEFSRKLGAQGWIGMTWPKEYGGRNAEPMELIIWGQEESRYDVPVGPYAIGLGMCLSLIHI